MTKYIYFLLFGFLFSCVPIKKYKELESNYDRCQKERSEYKSSSIDYENKFKELMIQVELLEGSIFQLKSDTTQLGNKLQVLQVEYQKVLETNKALELKYADIVASGTVDNAKLINDLERSRIDLQRKQDQLNELEKRLNAKERLLNEKEKRINELEEIIASKDEAVRLLKEKISAALRGFADKGITVIEKNGKIYVSMEAQLLFASGKIDVSKEGEGALINLARVLEDQKDIDILVEGHTDSDAMNSNNHPRDNWELSVLRATAVVKIMLNNSNMDPIRISAAGRSKHHPIDPNNKAKNRRIEIIITPDLSELFELISSE